MFWLYPFHTQSFVLVDVPARHGWWVWNFVIHWTFGLEALICAWAAADLARSGRRRRAAVGTVNR
jgi:inner membrane protein